MRLMNADMTIVNIPAIGPDGMLRLDKDSTNLSEPVLLMLASQDAETLTDQVSGSKKNSEQADAIAKLNKKSTLADVIEALQAGQITEGDEK